MGEGGCLVEDIWGRGRQALAFHVFVFLRSFAKKQANVRKQGARDSGFETEQKRRWAQGARYEITRPNA